MFTGNFRLSYFEWLNDGEIAVYQGCGTECMVAYHIDLIKQTRRLSLGGIHVVSGSKICPSIPPRFTARYQRWG